MVDAIDKASIMLFDNNQLCAHFGWDKNGHDACIIKVIPLMNV